MGRLPQKSGSLRLSKKAGLPQAKEKIRSLDKTKKYIFYLKPRGFHRRKLRGCLLLAKTISTSGIPKSPNDFLGRGKTTGTDKVFRKKMI